METNELIYSLQHPNRDNPAPYDKGGVGIVEEFQFELDGDNDAFSELTPLRTEEERGRVRVAAGKYNLLA